MAVDLTFHDDHTLDKVYAGLRSAIAGLTDESARGIISHLQSRGILFRESYGEELPLAADAMLQAVRFAQGGNTERARTWVLIARELREGSKRGNEIDRPWMDEPRRADFMEVALLTPRRPDHADEPMHKRVERLIQEAAEEKIPPPIYKDAAGEPPTERLQGPFMRCGNCRETMVTTRDGRFVHALTGEPECRGAVQGT